LRAVCALFLALWVPLAPIGRATCLAAGTSKAAAKPQLRCHEDKSDKSQAAKQGCCCKRTPTLSARNCGCHHGGEGAWPVVRDQAMPARLDGVAATPSGAQALSVRHEVVVPIGADPPELPPPEPNLSLSA